MTEEVENSTLRRMAHLGKENINPSGGMMASFKTDLTLVFAKIIWILSM